MPRRRKIDRRKFRKNTKLPFLLFICVVIFWLALLSVNEFRQHKPFPKPTWKKDRVNTPDWSDETTKNKEKPNKPSYNSQTYYDYMDSLFEVRIFWIPDMDSTTFGEIVDHEFFMLSYNELYEQPHWVAYNLNRRKLSGSGERTDNFKSDPKIVTGSAHSKDFSYSGYDRGHLAPAADFAYAAEAMEKSFYMSNISPQVPGFNRGIWKKLEIQVRSWAINYEEILVITGPLFEEKSKGLMIGDNEVRIPEYFYKIIFDIYPPEYKMIAFLLKNETSNVPLLDYAVSVDSLEQLSGFDFFPMIPDSLELRLEENEKYEIWFE